MTRDEGTDWFRTLFDAATQFMGLLDVDGRVLDANRRALDFAGVALDDVVGSTAWSTPWFADDAESARRLRDAVAAGRAGHASRFEARHANRRGDRVTVDFALTPLRDGAGQVVRLLAEGHDITARQRTESRLRDSEARLRALAEAMPQFVFETSARGRLMYTNARWQAYTGLSAEALDSVDPAAWRSVMPPDDAERTARAWATSLFTGDDFDVLCRVRRAADGALRWFHVQGVPIRRGDGTIDRWVTVGVDVHDQRVAEDRLRASEVRLRNVFELAAGGMALSDARGRIVDCNPALSALVGTPLEQIRGTHLAQLAHEDDRALLQARLRALADGEAPAEPIEHRMLRRGEPPLWVQTSCRLEQEHGLREVGIVWSFADIEARKRAQDDLQASRSRQRELAETMRLMLETAAQGIVSVDAQGRIVMANAAVDAMFGWPRGALRGQPIEVLVPLHAVERHVRLREAYWAAPRARPVGPDAELLGRRHDGSTFPVEIALNHIATADGGRAVAFITDISERKAAQAEVEASHAALRERAAELERRAEQLSRLASELTVAEQRAREELSQTLHDHLQQMLVSARLQVDLLAQDATSADRGRDREALQRLAAELDDAIAASRSLSVELFPPILYDGGLPDALAWLAGWMKKKHGLEVELLADERADPRAKDVRTLLFASVRELLFNIVKHARVGRARVVLALPNDDEVSITVADEGVGFDAASLLGPAHRQAPGLGLLSIAERLQLMGGRFDVVSQPGRGSRFTLVAPRQPAARASGFGELDAPARTPGAGDDAFSPRRRLRLVVADDHESVRAGLRALLTAQPGLQVVGEAVDGEQAVALVRELDPDVAILDVRMPRLSGAAAARRIRAERPRTTIVALSSQERGEGVPPIVDAGAAAYFVKGVDTQRLLDYLGTLQRE